MLGNISRRAFLWITGGSGAAIMLKPARQFVEKLIPYVNPPKYPKPGEWAFFATTCRECPAGCGMLMWHRDGRVTKAEGNPFHPLNRGKLCIRGQSSVQGQYDPDRLTRVLNRQQNGSHQESSWQEALDAIRSGLNQSKPAVVSDLQTGSMAKTLEGFTKKWGGPPPVYYEAFHYEAIRKAHQQLYNQERIPRYDLEGCDLIVSFNTDFLETWLAPVEYARGFGDFHSLKNNRIGTYLYLGATRTMSAANADRYIRIEPGKEALILYTLANRLKEKGVLRDTRYQDLIPPAQGDTGLDETTLNDLSEHIQQAKDPFILAGSPTDNSPQAVEAAKAGALLNELLGNRKRIDFAQYHALSLTAQKKEVHEFFRSLNNEDILVIHNTNPVFTEPGIEKHIKKAGKVIYIGTMMNETAELADWVLPSNYPLEEWGDYEPWRGTLSLLQPTMAPVFDTRPAGQILMDLTDESPAISYKDRVRTYWQDWSLKNNGALKRGRKSLAIDKTPQFYDRALQSACIQASFSKEHPSMRRLKPDPAALNQPLRGASLHFMLYPSLFLYDGRLSNRAWLQEIPHPVTNIVWQSWAEMNSQKAEEMGIQDGERIKVTAGANTKEVSVRLTQDTDPNTLAMYAGQGHWAMGENAKGTGINAFALMNGSGQGAWVKIEKTGQIDSPLYLQPTDDQHERELLRHVDLEKLTHGTAHREKINWPLPRGYDKEHDMYEPHKHEDHRWAMVIDLQKCIGCKACEAACYAENNIITVGRKNLEEGREMSWLKVTPYKMDKERTAFLPVPCQHCDSAPCEPVCPVFASVHTEEGLNAQIYNRCIGTRYCSNNCPYKVRRFNWVPPKHPFPKNLQLNPEVTVRDHGVMEKCTFCIQRIKNVQYQAKKENRAIKDQEIQPACVQTCPTDAIVFGDLHDKNSRVRQLFEDRRRYQLLGELNTKPAVVYLKKIRIKA